VTYPAHVQEKIDEAMRTLAVSGPREGTVAMQKALGLAKAAAILNPIATANAEQLEPKMNGLEARYATHLDFRKHAGEVAWWRFNTIRFRIGKGAWYKPDFMVVLVAALELEVHETKGHWREAARVRIKTAADLYPLRFVAVTEDEDGWHFERFGGSR
jgi:hypothetical protein